MHNAILVADVQHSAATITLLHAHGNKCSYHLPTYIITILLVIFPSLFFYPQD